MNELLSGEIERQFPFLRQFACAAISNEVDANSYVARALELLILEIESGTVTTPNHVKFRAFQLLEIVMASHSKIPPASIKERVRILLHVSEFTELECRQILDLNETSLRRYISEISEGLD